MSLALALFQQCKGVIRSKHLKTKEKQEQHELQVKQQKKQERATFRQEYYNDIHYYSGVPNTPLGRYLLRNFTLIFTNGKKAWFHLWVRHLYPTSFYTKPKQHLSRCRLPQA